jgi:hypothetical protein
VVEAPVVELPTAVVEPAPEPAVVVEAPFVPGTPVVETPPAVETETLGGLDDSEVIVTREFLEEPLPGSGWDASAPMVVEEETIEDVVPTGADVVRLYAGPEIESPVPEGTEARAVPAWEEEVAEWTAAAPTVELMPETVVVEEVSAEELLVEEPVVESAVVEEPVATLVVEPPMVESPVTGAPIAERPVVAAPASEPVVVEPTVVESPVVELPVVEQPVVELPVEEATPVVEAQRVDDLKARIEETRRRIRRELEQPFITLEETKAPEPDWTVSSAIPVTGQIEEMEAPAEKTGGLELEPEEYDAEIEMAMEGQEPLDYESMKSRIESTRSRLKAKAFDAMMMGESALLGRDVDDPSRKRKLLPEVDSEVDETIESSLREEDD